VGDNLVIGLIKVEIIGRQMVLWIKAVLDPSRLRIDFDFQRTRSRRVVGESLDDGDAIRVAQLFTALRPHLVGHARQSLKVAPLPEVGTRIHHVAQFHNPIGRRTLCFNHPVTSACFAATGQFSRQKLEYRSRHPRLPIGIVENVCREHRVRIVGMRRDFNPRLGHAGRELAIGSLHRIGKARPFGIGESDGERPTATRWTPRDRRRSANQTAVGHADSRPIESNGVGADGGSARSPARQLDLRAKRRQRYCVRFSFRRASGRTATVVPTAA